MEAPNARRQDGVILVCFAGRRRDRRRAAVPALADAAVRWPWLWIAGPVDAPLDPDAWLSAADVGKPIGDGFRTYFVRFSDVPPRLDCSTVVLATDDSTCLADGWPACSLFVGPLRPPRFPPALRNGPDVLQQADTALPHNPETQRTP